MINKTISTQSSKILSYFHQLDQYCFDIMEAKKALPGSSESALKELLSDMVRRGLLLRLKKGLYHLIPYEQESETFMPEWHLLAEPLTKGTQHYIGYYSALQIHDLITQPSLKEQIVVSKQLRPSQIDIRGITFQFIYHNKEHFFGAKRIWVDSYNKVWCSDLEKTFVDCLFKPNYSGGIVEIAKAIYASKDKINFTRLFEYANKFNSKTVIKRLGYLLELLEINTEITEQLQKITTSSNVLLDPELPPSGTRCSRWSIQKNLDSETIKTAMFS
jgi:predicted transcriptional regulator of viral defense system